MTGTATKEKLDRSIGPGALALAIINTVVGSGIFVIPAIISDGLGASAILAYLVCGVVVFLVGLCFAELGSRTDISGGTYTYIEKAFGPFAGFLASSVYWLGGSVAADAAVANVLVGFLKIFFPVLGDETVRIIFIFIVFASLTLLNVRSSKGGIRLVQFTAIGKLLPLVLLVLVAVPHVDAANLRWDITPTAGNVGKASLLLFFAFVGMEAPLSNGGEIKNPARTVPLGILVGIGCVLLLYISIQLMTQGVLGASINTYRAAPLAAVADVAIGQVGSKLIVATSAMSVLGMLAGEIFSIPRIIFASARDGLMPRPFAKVHPRFATPHVAIIFYAFLGFVLAVSGSFELLAVLSSASVLLIYFGVMMATLRFKLRDKSSRQGFKVPGGPVIPAIGGVAVAWVLSNLALKELKAMLVFIAALSVIYFINKVWKRKVVVIPPG
ncbi:MAG: amino acid permease [Chitinophagaceae bacterium]|nr:MAG: amino acid permease [Chitinophagaceae bacterium]